MKSAITIDAAGRVVLPSEARRLLNLRPGSRLELSVTAERIVLTPEPGDDVPRAAARGRRKVLAPTGRPFDAAAATRDERSAQAQARRRAR